jgi:hypothetical protein
MGHKAAWRVMFLATVLAGGTSLGACASSGNKPAGRHPTTTINTTTTTSQPPQSTVTTSTTPAVLTCSPGVLGITSSPGGVAAGTSYTVFTLTNRGSTRCDLEGYPSLRFFGPSGASGAGAGPLLDITAIDRGRAPSLVTLAGGGSAEFIVVINDVPVGGVGCATVASVNVSISGTNEAIGVPVAMKPFGGSVSVYAFGPPDSESP